MGAAALSKRRSLSIRLRDGDGVAQHDTPVGRLTLVTGAAGLVGVLWAHEAIVSTEPRRDEVLDDARRQLDAYFAGRLTRFTLPLDLRGTAFQTAVWTVLATIPFGTTRTYGQFAHQLGQPTATRAVGAANGRNPLSIVLPCHRVVGGDGSLTGFGGGLDAKRYLLAHEGAADRLLL